MKLLLRLETNYFSTFPVIICPILEKSIERHKKFYVNEINGKYHKAKYPLLKRIAIHVEEGCTNIGYPSQTSKENYNLTVEYPRAIITANEVWGALRGIESLTQLIYPDRYHIRPLINETCTNMITGSLNISRLHTKKKHSS